LRRNGLPVCEICVGHCPDDGILLVVLDILRVGNLFEISPDTEVFVRQVGLRFASFWQHINTGHRYTRISRQIVGQNP
jgi:hypothetical protein